MRVVFVIVAFALALLFQTAVAEAACVDAVADQSSATVTQASVSSMDDAHCVHFPCSDSSHRHASCVCVGHFFVPVLSVTPPSRVQVADRVALTDDTMAGRTLLPPVPPPLG